MHKFSSRFVIAGALAVAFGTSAVSAPRPAQAATSSTTYILLGAAAIAGIVLYNNWQHRQAQTSANTIIGRTSNGGYVYADGRIVNAGQTYYASNDGTTPCSYIAYGGSTCGSHVRGYTVAHNATRPQWDNSRRNWTPPSHQNNGNRGNNGNNGHGNDGKGNNGHQNNSH
jgi:hypothetical protein